MGEIYLENCNLYDIPETKPQHSGISLTGKYSKNWFLEWILTSRDGVFNIFPTLYFYLENWKADFHQNF